MAREAEGWSAPRPDGFSPGALADLLQAEGLAAALLTSPENVYYTTGYTVLPSSGNPILYALRTRLPFFAVVDRSARVTLLPWRFAAAGVAFSADEVVGFDDLAGAHAVLERFLRERLAAGSALAVESSCPAYVLDIAERAGFAGCRRVADELLAGLRLVKSADEVRRIAESTRIVEQTVGELRGSLHVGMSRLDLTREAKWRLLRNGADGVSHITFTFGAANPEIALAEALQPGQLVTLDLGAVFEGYVSDNRRYALAGAVPARLEAYYRTLVEIVDGVGAALAPGASFGQVFQRGVELFRARGLAPAFNHVGHSIGLETEERWLGPDDPTRVQPGMVINIELYAPVEGFGRVGDEETYAVEAGGPRRLTLLDRTITPLPAGAGA